MSRVKNIEHESRVSGLVVARKMRGLSQGELAARAKLLPMTISHYETGERGPSLENLVKLADALNVSVDFLIGRETSLKAAGPESNRLLELTGQISARDLTLLIAQALAMTKSGHQQ